MDGLCQITNSTTQPVYIPAPDYDGAPPVDYNSNPIPQQSQYSDGHLTKSYIQNNMSSQMKEISKGVLKATHDRQPQPEFLAKQHQMKTSALRKQEKKEFEENNELFAKLKSRSQAIDQDEKKKEEEENLPEFMKLKLKSKPAGIA